MHWMRIGGPIIEVGGLDDFGSDPKVPVSHGRSSGLILIALNTWDETGPRLVPVQLSQSVRSRNPGAVPLRSGPMWTGGSATRLT